MKELQRDLGLSMIFITHDLSVLVEVSDVLAIMYAGKIVEQGPATEVFYDSEAPVHEGARGRVPRDRRPAVPQEADRAGRRPARPAEDPVRVLVPPALPGGVRRMPDARARAVSRPAPAVRPRACSSSRHACRRERSTHERDRDDRDRRRTVVGRQRDRGPGPPRDVRRSRRAHRRAVGQEGLRGEGGGRDLVRAAARRGPGARRRVGVRQDHHGPGDHGSAGGQRGRRSCSRAIRSGGSSRRTGGGSRWCSRTRPAA